MRVLTLAPPPALAACARRRDGPQLMPERAADWLNAPGTERSGIVELKDVVLEKDAYLRPQYRMIMELMTGGELFAHVVDNGGLSEEDSRHFFRQIMMAMAYCAKKKLGAAHQSSAPAAAPAAAESLVRLSLASLG